MNLEAGEVFVGINIYLGIYSDLKKVKEYSVKIIESILDDDVRP